MHYKLTLLLLICVVLYQPTAAQSGEIRHKKEIKKLEDDGEVYFEKGEYQNALKYFLELLDYKPSEPYYNLVVGICYTYDPDNHAKAFDYLNKAKRLNPDFDQVDLYLARAYYKSNQFQKAIDILNEILAKQQSDDITENEARQLIQYCRNALEITADTVENVRIINMGNVINTPEDEYAPLVLPDESQMIYTYRGVKSTGGKLNEDGEPDELGRYSEDIFLTVKSPDNWMYDEDVWLEPKGLSQINTDLDDASIALSIDGQMLFLYKFAKENGGDILSSKLDGSTWQEPTPLKGDVNTKHWEGSVSISSDGQVLYFSSDRPGGYGGRDLYKAEKQADGSWGNVQNLGPEINTPLNDDSPFLHLDKKTLYFSSQGHNSMGGYDVFFAVDDNGKWTNVKNMGAPVNTTEDDMFYVANADGTKGFYSSAYGKGSQGKQDIYIVTPDVGRIDLDPMAALIVGFVYGDDAPIASEITVTDLTLSKPAGTFYSNSETGSYRIALLPGSRYKIDVKAENFETHTDEIDLETLHEYIEVSNNVYLYSDEYAANNEVHQNQSVEDALHAAEEKKEMAVVVIPPVVTGKKEEEEVVIAATGAETKKDEAVVVPPVKKDSPCPDIVDLSAFIGKDLNKEPNYIALKKEIGDYCAKELEYRVQIGAYRFPQNFKYDNVKQYGEAVIKDYPDGITRFTMGVFTTLNEADGLRQQIIKSGIKDAWVIPFYDGQRIFMEDLISVNFYKQLVN